MARSIRGANNQLRGSIRICTRVVENLATIAWVIPPLLLRLRPEWLIEIEAIAAVND
jgi:hypothetical protein